MADQNYKLRFDFIANNERFNSAIGVSSNKLKSFGNQMTKTGRMLSTRLSLPLAALGGLAVKQAANFERLQTTLNTLTGSAEAGAEAFERLVQFSAKTPFQLNELVKVNNTLMGFGLNADQAFNSLSMLGDIAGIVGGDLQSIGIAFGQAAAEGRVMTRDLRQFINNGVPILDILAESMGVARGEIMDMASEGKITFDILNSAFRNATSEGGKFEGGMNTLSTTLNGLFSTLKDNVNIALAELGQEIADVLNLKEGIPALSNRIRSLVDNFKRLDPNTQEAIIKFGVFAALIPPLLIVLGSLIGILSTTAGGYAALGIAIVGVNEAIKGFVEQLTGIKNFNIISFVVGPLGQLAEVLLRIANIKNPFKELFKLNDPANLPPGFIGPRTKNQTFGDDPLLAAILSSNNNVSTSTTSSAKGSKIDFTKMLGFDKFFTTDLQESLKVGFVNTVKGFKTELDFSTVFSDVSYSMQDLTSSAVVPLTNKVKELSQTTLSFATHIGQTLMAAFANLGQGESAFEKLGEQLKALIVRLAIAASLALLISAALGNPAAFNQIFGALSGISGIASNATTDGATAAATGVTSMARGGIVSTPTNALIGEYPGARSNPEVVAPLSKLKTMIGGGAMQGEFVLRGQDLVVALQRAERNRNRFK
jgi:tape measure domain-containing protein